MTIPLAKPNIYRNDSVRALGMTIASQTQGPEPADKPWASCFAARPLTHHTIRLRCPCALFRSPASPSGGHGKPFCGRSLEDFQKVAFVKPPCTFQCLESQTIKGGTEQLNIS